MTVSAPPLSRVRTFLFGGFALVWLGEALFTGIQPLAEAWTTFWKMYAPDNPQLATALYITHAFEAPLKAALLVLALFGLVSRNPSARTALFVSMSLVPRHNPERARVVLSLCLRQAIYAAAGRTRGDL